MNALKQMMQRLEEMEAEIAALRASIGGAAGSRPWKGSIVYNPKVAGQVTPTNDPNKCWVKPLSATGTNDTSPPVLLLCRQLVPQVGLPVTVGTLHGNQEQEVLGVVADDLALLPNYTGDTFNTPLHGDSHGWERSPNYPYSKSKKDRVSLGVRNLTPLRVTPSAAGGLKIDIGSYGDFGGYVGLDLSAAQPASGLARFVTVYLDNITNTIKTVNGSTIADNTAVNPPKSAPTDNDYIICAYVRLDGDATSFADGDIDDPRLLFNSGDTIPVRVEASFADQDAPTAGEIAALNLRPGHIVWQGGTADYPNHAWVSDANGDLTKVNENSRIPWRIEGSDSTGGQQTQPRVGDSVTVNNNVQHIGNVLIGGAVGDTTLGAVNVHKPSSTAYANAVPNATTLPFYVKNDQDHVSGGVYTGFMFNLPGNSQNRIAFFGGVTESASTRKIAFVICTDDGGSRTEKFRLTGDGRLAIGAGAASPVAQIDVIQNGSSTTIPVLRLEQANDSEDFIEYNGKSVAANLTKTLVDDADVTTATLVGWRKVVVTDANGNITSAAYYEPFYSLA